MMDVEVVAGVASTTQYVQTSDAYVILGTRIATGIRITDVRQIY
jgi:hypothetical protein